MFWEHVGVSLVVLRLGTVGLQAFILIKSPGYPFMILINNVQSNVRIGL